MKPHFITIAVSAIAFLGAMALAGALVLSALGRQAPSEITNIAAGALAALAAILPGIASKEDRP